MDLTPENKRLIDNMSLYTLFEKWRFAPIGDKLLQGETGKYMGKRLAELRDKDNANYVAISKELGWKK